MKKNHIRSVIFGLFIISFIGLTPVFTSGAREDLEFQPRLYVENQRGIDFLPIETTLSPIQSMNEIPYLENFGFNFQGDNNLSNGTFLEYNLQTDTSTVLDSSNETFVNSNLFKPQKGIIPSYMRDLPSLYSDEVFDTDMEFEVSDDQNELIRPQFVFPPDKREVVEDTTQFPFSSIVKIYATARNGSGYIGSGAIIDEYHVLTAAHVAYIHEAGGMVTRLEVVPGKSLDFEPFGSAFAVDIRLPSEWVEFQSYRHDWALITLDRPIGNLTGWMGIATYDPSDPVYRSTVFTAGFPGDKAFGEEMYNTTDLGKRADEYNHWFALDTQGGQSGSPVWTINASGENIISVLAYGYVNGIDWNFGTRINTEIFDQLGTWIMQDSELVKKADLRTFSAGATIDSSLELYKLRTRFRILIDVENSGTIAAENVQVSFYLSQDNTITTDDFLLGEDFIDNLFPLESKSASWYGFIPRDVPNGQYFIGWIIDPEDGILEYTENDNWSRFEEQITVNSSALTDFVSTPLGLGTVIAVTSSLVVITAAIAIYGVKKRKKKRELARLADYNPYY